MTLCPVCGKTTKTYEQREVQNKRPTGVICCSNCHHKLNLKELAVRKLELEILEIVNEEAFDELTIIYGSIFAVSSGHKVEKKGKWG